MLFSFFARFEDDVSSLFHQTYIYVAIDVSFQLQINDTKSFCFSESISTGLIYLQTRMKASLFALFQIRIVYL